MECFTNCCKFVKENEFENVNETDAINCSIQAEVLTLPMQIYYE